MHTYQSDEIYVLGVALTQRGHPQKFWYSVADVYYNFLLEAFGGTGHGFFFSSRRRHTIFKCDWSSDVCSSDLLGSQLPGSGFEYAGWRLRSRMRAPESWRLPVNVGFSAEYEATRSAFSDSPRTAELTAIFERRFGTLQLLADPTVERDLVGSGHEWEFEPRARAGLDIGRVVTLGFEWYGSLGDENQWHQFYPTADLRLADDMTLHLGVGFGGASASDRLV